MTHFKMILAAGLLFAQSAAADEMYEACKISGAPDDVCGCVEKVSYDFLTGEQQDYFLKAAEQRMKIGDWAKANLRGGDKAKFSAAFAEFQKDIKRKCDVSY